MCKIRSRSKITAKVLKKLSIYVNILLQKNNADLSRRTVVDFVLAVKPKL